MQKFVYDEMVKRFTFPLLTTVSFFIISFIFSPLLSRPANAEGELCCIQGFKTDVFNCPLLGVDKTKQCCSRKGFGQYDFADKVQCSAENADNNHPPDSLPPCAHWEYAFPTGSPDFRLNNIQIPTGNPEYIDPNFTNRKCVEVQTGIGPISTDPQEFVKSVFKIVLGMAGGIALILIMLSGYKFMASQGNPEAVKAAQEQLTSAVVGLLFIIFSFVILQVIGVDLLKIPGFQP